jgi:hypothetical protein
MITLLSSNIQWRVWVMILLMSAVSLAGCAQAASSPVPSGSSTVAAVSKDGQQLIAALDSTSAATPTPEALPASTDVPTAMPSTSAQAAAPTKKVLATATPTPKVPPTVAPTLVPATATEAPQPTVVPTSVQAVNPTQPVAVLPPLVVSPSAQALPAGSSASFRVNADDACAHSYTFQAQGLPAGITAEFLGDATPCRNTLVLTVPVAAAPGSYSVQVVAMQTDTSLSTSTQIALTVTGCQEFQQGEFSQTIQSNLVTLITAGKPSIEHGLLVPLQVCQDRLLRVTLTSATSEAGTPMATPPRFYLYRSLVWPAPSTITAHGLWPNVKVPRINSDGWQLQGTIGPGLYLLVFERDYYTIPAITDPASFPASVTYRIEAGP